MDYIKFKTMKQNAVNNASWNKFNFFAYSEKQFEEGCKRVNAKKNRKGKWMLTRMPGGGFMTHKGIASWNAFWDNWERYESKFNKNDDYIIEGLVYEYGNHEAQIDSYGESKKNAEELFPEATEDQKKRAWKKFWNMCIKNDWF